MEEVILNKKQSQKKKSRLGNKIKIVQTFSGSSKESNKNSNVGSRVPFAYHIDEKN